MFLGPDPLWDGIERLPELNVQTARRWPTRTGPLDSPLAAFAQLLPTTWFIATSPEGVSIASLERSAPRSAAVLRRLAPEMARWSALSLVEAIDEVIDEL